MMIRALAWAMRQHPDRMTSLEKLVLIYLADVSDEDNVVHLNRYKIARFASMTQEDVNDILLSLADKGYIKPLEDDIETLDKVTLYKLIVTQ